MIGAACLRDSHVYKKDEASYPDIAGRSPEIDETAVIAAIQRIFQTTHEMRLDRELFLMLGSEDIGKNLGNNLYNFH